MEREGIATGSDPGTLQRSMGTFAIQIAKSFGAEVTGVDSTEKLDILRSFGADPVIDFTREDFTQSGKTYDVIFEVAGKSPFSGSLSSLKPNGRYLPGNPGAVTQVAGTDGFEWRQASHPVFNPQHPRDCSRLGLSQRAG